MKPIQPPRAVRSKQIETLIRQTAQEIDALTLPYLPSLTRGQVGAAFLKLIQEIVTTQEEV